VKRSFHAAPTSIAGKAAAKQAFQNDNANLSRSAY
jgi:hypothetical protein